MDILKNIYKELIKRRIIVIIGAIILLIIGFFSFRGDKEPEYNLAIAERGSIREEVSVTGKIEAIESIDLSFRATGNVSQVLIETESKVKKGQVLASLENNDLWAQLRQAQANLEAEEAKLQEIKKGTRLETINIKQVELFKSRQDLDNYYLDILDILNDSYIKADDAIKVKTSGIFSGYKTTFYQLTFNSCDNQATIDASNMRLSSELKLDQWREDLYNLNKDLSYQALIKVLEEGKDYLVFFNDFLERTYDNLVTGCTINDSNFDAYRTNINLGRTNIITAIANINNLGQNIASQGLLVEKIQKELDLLLAGSTEEQIIAQEAKVKYAQANVSNHYAFIEKTVIRAPINGFIAKKEIKKGEVALANVPVISLMAEKGLQIKTYVPEVDVSKIEVGDRVLITLDAFPRKEFFGEIIHIDSAETIIDGVVYYKVKSTIDIQDTNVKSGMTADIIIIIDLEEDALIIPRRAVIEKDKKSIVRIPVNGDFQEIEVETGLVGSDGNIEIISGLKEGDEVITFIKK